MKVINSVITVQLTGIDQATLSNAYTILNELYKIIDENDCERATDALTDESYDRATSHLRLLFSRRLPLLKRWKSVNKRNLTFY